MDALDADTGTKLLEFVTPIGEHGKGHNDEVRRRALLS